MVYRYSPKGVCSKAFVLEIEDRVIRKLVIEGGCDGNLKGIARLIENRPIEEIIPLLAGITCDKKTTSCPDQLAKALSEITTNK